MYPRFSCAALCALVASTTAYCSTVSFSTHTAPCSSSLCTLTHLQNADLNGDGLEDLIAVDPASGTFRVTFNQGNGSFSSPVDYTLPSYNGTLLTPSRP